MSVRGETAKSLAAFRTVLLNQGKWIYFLTKEGIDMGLSGQFAKDAMYELGEVYADEKYAECDTLEKLRDSMMDRAMTEGFGAKAKLSGEELRIDIAYDPMYRLWSELTDDQAELEMLCEVACEFYRGLADKKGMPFERTPADGANDGAFALIFRV